LKIPDIVKTLLPNDTGSFTLNMNDLFEDDDSLMFSHVEPSGRILITHLFSNVYEYSISLMTAGETFSLKIIADDSISKPTELTVNINVGNCSPECTKCYGNTVNE